MIFINVSCGRIFCIIINTVIHATNYMYIIFKNTSFNNPILLIQDIIEEESLDNFNLPFYSPTASEVKKLIQEEGSFSLRKLDLFELPWDAGFSEPTSKSNNSIDDKHKRGKYISDYLRAVVEPILVEQFGEAIMDDLFQRFTDKVIEFTAKEKWQYVNIVISLAKKTQA